MSDNEPPHVGMNGGPCRCTPERRAWYTRGCAETCPCHGLPHARCPRAEPCLGHCGRLTTAHETIAGGYCIHCAALAPHTAIVWRGMGFSADGSRLNGGALAQCVRDLQLPAAILEGFAMQRSRAAADQCRTRNDGRQWPGRPSFREDSHTLPQFIEAYAGFVHSVLDAPYVAAQVATGRCPWSHRIERLLRMNRAFDPGYFDEVLAMQIVVEWQAKRQ